MGSSEPTRGLNFAVALFKLLIAPVVLLVVGLAEFVYQAGWGHDQSFGMIGVGLAVAGAGLGADLLGKVR